MGGKLMMSKSKNGIVTRENTLQEKHGTREQKHTNLSEKFVDCLSYIALTTLL